MINKNKYYVVFIMGIILQATCILGGSIYSINKYNDISDFFYKVVLIPNIMSFALIIAGLIGLFFIDKNKK